MSATPDAWADLRRHTAARVALGRCGGSLPTAEVLRFAFDHAAARDAVHCELDLDALQIALAPLGLPVIRVSTGAPDRSTYLQRPDLGRLLDDASRTRLEQVKPADVVIIVADGLSSVAASTHAGALLSELMPLLHGAGVTVGPLVLARQARVGVQDDVGASAHAVASLILLGERPGLAVHDSLGAYLVFDPRPGTPDARRNCVSNIRPAGLPLPAAAATIAYLLTESLRRRLSGVTLKDDRAAPRLGGASPMLPPAPSA